MSLNNSEGLLFNNGPALLTQLKKPKVLNYLEKIAIIERQSQFHVLKYWNRRWEYPFILSIGDTFNPKGFVLDAGAGQSLMPFLLQNNQRNIVALDIDDGSFYPQDSLSSWYKNMNNVLNSNINFINGNLVRTDFINGYFDFIYSISVLEHLSDPMSGLTELWRILKPGGIIAITIDVSLDDSRGMYSKDIKAIQSFLSENATPLYPETYFTTADMITTDWFKKNEPEGLPWSVNYRGVKARIKNLVSGRWDSLGRTTSYFASLLVTGLVYRKPESN
jgi:ubiquinone/menaquinone biosynthesis C-methylase UbiE